MHEGKRPGGLTALAVFNFIGAGYDLVFSFLPVLALIAFGGKLAEVMEVEFRKQAEQHAKEEGRASETAEITRDQQNVLDAMRAYEKGMDAIVQAAGIVICAGLLLAGGVGYLRQRRWGRVLGNLYVIASVASTVHAVRMVPPEYGGGLRFAALLYFVYPILTLYLLNWTFREDLKR